MLTSGHDKMRISVVNLNFGHASQRSKDLKFGCASQRSHGFVEGDICANAYEFFTLVLAIATIGEYGKRSQSAICFRDLSFEAMLKRFIL